MLVTFPACIQIQVRTMYELAINEISESSQKAKSILQAQHNRDRQMLEASAQVLLKLKIAMPHPFPVHEFPCPASPSLHH